MDIFNTQKTQNIRIELLIEIFKENLLSLLQVKAIQSVNKFIEKNICRKYQQKRNLKSIDTIDMGIFEKKNTNSFEIHYQIAYET